MRARFFTRFAATALAAAAGGGLLASGVAEAAPLSPGSPIDPAILCALNIGTSTATSATTTTLFTAPIGGLSEGFPVVLVAIVTPCAAKGTVQFLDGNAPIGAPLAVTGGFGFTIVPTLAAGIHSLTATFTPVDSPLDPSTSASVSRTVSPRIVPDIPLLQQLLDGHLFSPDPARLIEFLHGVHSGAPSGR